MATMRPFRLNTPTVNGPARTTRRDPGGKSASGTTDHHCPRAGVRGVSAVTRSPHAVHQRTRRLPASRSLNPEPGPVRAR